jgi:hypothetical protein
MKISQRIRNPEKETPHSMELSASEAYSRSAGQEIPHRAWRWKIP